MSEKSIKLTNQIKFINDEYLVKRKRSLSGPAENLIEKLNDFNINSNEVNQKIKPINLNSDKQQIDKTSSVDNRVRYMSGNSNQVTNVYRSNVYRPRSNSEGKSKKPSLIMSKLRKSVHLPWQTHSKHINTQSTSCPITPNLNETKPMKSIDEENLRVRTSSESSTSNYIPYNSKKRVVDVFRNRSLSMGYNDLPKRPGKDENESLLNSLPRRHSIDPETKKYRTRSIDFVDFNQSHFSLYRDARTSKNGSFNPFTSTESICDRLNFEDLQKDESLIFVKFFKFYHCYDLVPKSSKLVVFDTQLLFKKAFYALVNHGVRAAPLWDSNKQMFVGMLTITYFINVLINSYNNPEIKINELEEQKLETWKNSSEDKSPLITIDPESSVLDAIETLIKNKIHRLPIVDPLTNNVIYILTHKRVLKFFVLYFYYLPKPFYMDLTIEEVQVGTYNDIELSTMDTKLIDVMKKLVDRRISAVPIVDVNGKLIDIYSKFDIFNLASEKMYENLDMTIKNALKHRQHWFEGVIKCTPHEKFMTVIERIVKAEVHRIIVVNDDDFVIGIISLSDILQFLISIPSQFFSKKLSNEPLNEDLNEDLNEEDFFDCSFNNNDSSIKNHNHLKDNSADSSFISELQKIDEI